MGIRLIASDLDGTLLGLDHGISAENARVLRRAEESGVKVVLASGRSFHSVLGFARHMGISGPIISSNGARVQAADGTVIAECCLEPQSALAIMNVYDSMGLFYELYNDDIIFLSTVNPANPSAEAKLAGTKAGNVDFRHDPQAMREYGALRAHKIVVFDPDPQVIAAAKSNVAQIPGLELNSSWRDNIEAMHAGIDKGWAMRKLLAHCRIDADEAMAFGDNLNDRGMLLNCAWPVAMLNATDGLKSIARIIAPHCNDSGVAAVVRKYVLCELDGE